MKPGHQGRSLFDVMSKAPQSSHPRRGGGFSLFARKTDIEPSVPMAAVALTEQEALAELAARRDEDHRKQDFAAEEAARVAASVRAAAAAQPEPNVPTESGDSFPTLSFEDGRLTLRLGTSGLLAIAGAMCVLVLVGYSLGKRPRTAQDALSTVAAVTREPAAIPVAPPIAKPTKRDTAASAHPELAELLRKPATKPQPPAVKANQPVGAIAGSSGESSRPEDLNYLQIESFLITRDRSGDQVAQDLAQARKFLADRGVRTFARRRSNGFLLYAEQGFPAAKDGSADRDRFRRRVEQLGQEFRSQGGQYQFKGCFFVSHAHTKTGDPH